MNIIPLILVLSYFLGNQKYSQYADVLKNLDYASFSPVLKLLGIDQKIIDFLSSDAFSNMVSGNADLKSIIPLLLNFIKPTAKTNPDNDGLNATDIPTDKLNPIKDVAPTDIEEKLETFFS